MYVTTFLNPLLFLYFCQVLLHHLLRAFFPSLPLAINLQSLSKEIIHTTQTLQEAAGVFKGIVVVDQMYLLNEGNWKTLTQHTFTLQSYITTQIE